jgi:hypothetical protein
MFVISFRNCAAFRFCASLSFRLGAAGLEAIDFSGFEFRGFGFWSFEFWGFGTCRVFSTIHPGAIELPPSYSRSSRGGNESIELNLEEGSEKLRFESISNPDLMV